MIEKIKEFGKLTKTKAIKDCVVISCEADENDADYIYETNTVTMDVFVQLLEEYRKIEKQYGFDHTGMITKDMKESLSKLELEEIEEIFDDNSGTISDDEQCLIFLIFGDYMPCPSHDYPMHSVDITFEVFDKEGMGFQFDLHKKI